MPYRRKHKKRFLGALLAGVSLPFLFLLLSNLITTGADIAALCGITVPTWVTGIASLIFIIGIALSFALERKGGGGE